MAAGKTTRTSTRVLALALAMVFALFFAEVAVHTHPNGQDDATCHVCQGAHIAPAPATGALISSPFVALEYVRPAAATFHQEFFFEDCPSRAPPSLFQ
jgi:hypothetical protein